MDIWQFVIIYVLSVIIIVFWIRVLTSVFDMCTLKKRKHKRSSNVKRINRTKIVNINMFISHLQVPNYGAILNDCKCQRERGCWPPKIHSWIQSQPVLMEHVSFYVINLFFNRIPM